MRLSYLLLLLGLLLTGSPGAAQRPRWEQRIDFPGTPGTDLFGYMRTLPGGDYLVYGMGSTGQRYLATVVRYHPDGTSVFQRQGRTLITLEQDMLLLPSGNVLSLASVPDYTRRPNAANLFFQRLRPTGDTLPGLRHLTSLFEGIPARMAADGDSVRLLLTALPNLPDFYHYALATADTTGQLGPIRHYPNPAPGYGLACDLVPAPRGGWLMVGELEGYTGNGSYHPYLAETDARGHLRRQRVLTLFSATDNERVARTWHNLIRLRDGSGYVLSGWQQVSGPGSANPIWGFLCKLDTTLNVVWTYRHPPQLTTNLLPTRVHELPDGTLGWLVGDGGGPGQTVTSHLYLLRVSAQGQLLRQRRFTSPACANLVPYSWQPTPDGYGAVVTGYAVNCAPTGAAAVTYTARLDSALVLAATPGLASGAGAAQLWPNPAREAVTWQGALPAGTAPAELLVLDALGRPVRRVAVAGRGAVVTQAVGLVGLASGAYGVRLLVAGLPVGAVSRLLVSAP